MLVWDDLRFFLAIARSGSQSAAARALGADQTTVGRRLTALEAHLGARLFTRSARGLLPTAAAEAIREAAERAERAMLAVERASSGLDTRARGTVRLATTDALARGFVLAAMADLRESHPEVKVVLTTAPETVDLVKGEADVALRTVRPVDSDLVVRKVGVVHHGLYAAPSYLARRSRPREAKGLTGHDVLEMAAGFDSAQRRFLTGVSTQGSRVVFEANNVVSLVRATELGMGLAVLPTFLVDEASSSALVRLWPDRDDAQDLWLAVHADVRNAARIRAVMESLAARVSPRRGGITEDRKKVVRKPPRR
ncbi:Transcriptional regulator, LysR family [Labilithrix luteola]|uniref:Transcriptional regulator, LysR family n=1 Tax=Labilithrix luteola TaxID=1391654 RepID=A0A0K1PKT0_9BACT|nr:LysR family transcriptional regulator [Labilithrix luteola]AKU94135.1 Transcriptional regulator, LysR family [Labilithrix luteola]